MPGAAEDTPGGAAVYRPPAFHPHHATVSSKYELTVVANFPHFPPYYHPAIP
jgi:hypothetical protein